jgi:hypothetical protein
VVFAISLDSSIFVVPVSWNGIGGILKGVESGGHVSSVSANVSISEAIKEVLLREVVKETMVNPMSAFHGGGHGESEVGVAVTLLNWSNNSTSPDPVEVSESIIISVVGVLVLLSLVSIIDVGKVIFAIFFFLILVSVINVREIVIAIVLSASVFLTLWASASVDGDSHSDALEVSSLLSVSSQVISKETFLELSSVSLKEWL